MVCVLNFNIVKFIHANFTNTFSFEFKLKKRNTRIKHVQTKNKVNERENMLQQISELIYDLNTYDWACELLYISYNTES